MSASVIRATAANPIPAAGMSQPGGDELVEVDLDDAGAAVYSARA
jgi:hypothetical protein